MDAGGNFVVVWKSPLIFGNDIYGQHFDSTGAKVGSEFLVDGAGSYDGNPRIARNAVDSSFIVVWQSDYLEGSGNGIFARRYDSSGNPLGGRFPVNTYTTGDQTLPAIAEDTLGRFIVVWQSDGQDGDSKGVFGQRYDDGGSPVGGEFRVNTTTSGFQGYPSVASVGSGGFLVVWQSGQQDGSASGIVARRFDVNGAGGPEFQINTYTTNYQTLPSVAVDGSGNFVVAWQSYGQDGSGYGVFGQRLDFLGTRVGTEFRLNVETASLQRRPSVATFGVSGNFVVAWDSLYQDGSETGVFDRVGLVDAPLSMAVDRFAQAGTASNLNGVLESGETVQVAPAWHNGLGISLPFSGSASNFIGPAGPTYTLVDGIANYGTIAAGSSSDCITAGADCFAVGISGSRPAAHWDATFSEKLNLNITKTWTLHVGESFADVAVGNAFYAYIENLFHNAVTGGCGAGTYCPGSDVTRAQMAVFLLKGRNGANFLPPPCAGAFPDVPCPSPFADWIEELANEGITAGCGGGNYCPSAPVTRQQMAVFLLKAEHTSLYTPPACTGVFQDVACPSQFADWIERLYAEGVTGGCGANPLVFCPTNPNTRGQMAVFLVKTFGLQLYGP